MCPKIWEEPQKSTQNNGTSPYHSICKLPLPPVVCYRQAASETTSWTVESLITVNGNTIMIMCLIKLIWTDWNLYQKVIECCLVSCNRKASLLQADILKFANSLKLPWKQTFSTNYLQTIFFQLLPPANKFFVIFGTPPVNIKWFVP